MKYKWGILCCGLVCTGIGSHCRAQELSATEVRASLRRAVEFFHGQAAAHGGYVYRYSADLSKQEGEGKTDRDTVWVQPPGTPHVGMAYLDAYTLTGEDFLLQAARDAGTCLLAGQLRSGGWSSEIVFDPTARRRFAYRIDPPRERARNWTTFDDDKSQAAMRFLMKLDQALAFQDERIHEAIEYALCATLAAQYPNGAWPQGFEQPPDPAAYPVLPAQYPESWSRIYSGGDYWQFYTLNDNAIVDVIETLKQAATIYDLPEYELAARRGAEFLLLAQLPDPQPAWAQQYDFQMQPTWARKFEPPAVSGGESQQIVTALLNNYEETRDARYLAAARRAVDYLQASRLPSGQLARFYELHSNRPLFMTRDYRLTYRPDDVPTHYAFVVHDRTPALRQRCEQLQSMSAEQLKSVVQRRRKSSVPRLSSDLRRRVATAISSQDERGAWVEAGRLKYHGESDETRSVIESATFARHLRSLAQFLAATQATESR